MKKTTTKKSVPAKQHVEVKHFRRPMFVQFISSIAIVFAFMAVLLAFNMITSAHVQGDVHSEVAELQRDVAALKQQMANPQMGSNGAIIARPVTTTAPFNQ